MGLAMGKKNLLYVTEGFNKRVAVYEHKEKFNRYFKFMDFGTIHTPRHMTY
jgi:hypothetical protein